jgi:hypothetical protein
MMYDLTTYSPHGNQMVFVYIGTQGTPIRVTRKITSSRRADLLKNVDQKS